MTRDDDALNAARGIAHGLLIGIVLWALILWFTFA